MNTVLVQLNPDTQLTDRQFQQLCQDNRNLNFERSAQGDLIIMSPTGGSTGNRNGRLNQQLFNWSDRFISGIAFDSSTGFKLPNGADRSPDAAWVTNDRWNTLTIDEQNRFIPLCPDFVVELMSPSDSRSVLQAKMQEYQDNGVRLGFLIDRTIKQIEIYRIGKTMEVVDRPTTLSGEDVLVGFELNMNLIW